MNDSTRERDEEGVRIDETLYRMIFLSTRPGLSLTKESNDSSQLIKIHMIIMNRWSNCHDRSNYKSIVSHLLTEWYNTCEIHNGYWMLGSVFLNLDCKDTERCKSERVRKWQIVKTACRGGIVHISDSAPTETILWNGKVVCRLFVIVTIGWHDSDHSTLSHYDNPPLGLVLKNTCP